MRKNIKICINIITAILPIVLSACSNKTNENNSLKSVKESNTTLAEDKSTDVTSSSMKTTRFKINATVQSMVAFFYFIIN